MTTEEEYTCGHCGGTFKSGWTEEEAEAERARLFGGPRTATDVRVCDECFQSIMAAMNG